METAKVGNGAWSAENNSDYLMNIIIENQLARIQELEKRLSKIQRESGSLKAYLRNNKAATAAAAASRKAGSGWSVENLSESSLLSAKGSELPGPKRTICKSAATPRCTPKLPSSEAMLAMTSPCSVQNLPGMQSPVVTPAVTSAAAAAAAAGTPVSKGTTPALTASAAAAAAAAVVTTAGSSGSAAAAAAAAAGGTSRYWTKEEHQKYLIARAKYGEKDFVNISAFVGTRTPRQVRTHGEKFQKKLIREEARRLSAEAAITAEAQVNIRATGAAPPTLAASATSPLGAAAALTLPQNPASEHLEHVVSLPVGLGGDVVKGDDVLCGEPNLMQDDCLVPDVELGDVKPSEVGLMFDGDSFDPTLDFTDEDTIHVPEGMEWPELAPTIEASF